jgi:hypothetical protein
MSGAPNGGTRKGKFDLAPVMRTAFLAAIKEVEQRKGKTFDLWPLIRLGVNRTGTERLFSIRRGKAATSLLSEKASGKRAASSARRLSAGLGDSAMALIGSVMGLLNLSSDSGAKPPGLYLLADARGLFYAHPTMRMVGL